MTGRKGNSVSQTWIDPNEGFAELFATIKRSSWRWECQGYYRVDDEAVQRWLDGEPTVDGTEYQEWRHYIRGLNEAGIPFQRARMLTEPLNDYLRWMLATTTQHNVAAGEDIRWLSENLARQLEMPGYDFFLFDDDRVVIMEFNDDKLLASVEL